MKSIVVFYSLEGNTRQAAQKIADSLHCDLMELKTQKEIKKGPSAFIIGGAQAVFGIKAKLQPFHVDFSQYDRIILGTPIWASTYAPAVHSFLSLPDICDKVHALFTCSGGGDNDKCVRQLKKKLSHLKYTTALADRQTPSSSQNAAKISAFTEALIHG